MHDIEARHLIPHGIIVDEHRITQPTDAGSIVMDIDRSETRRLLALVPLQLVTLAIGVKYAVGSGNVPKLIGWALVAASLLTLIGYALAIWRKR